ncbi:hypothetical protein GQ457_07G006830 [Hibiscus cannabinus]
MEELKLQLAPAAPKRADPGPGRVGARVTRASKRRRFTGELSVLSFFSDNSDDRRRGTPSSAAVRRRSLVTFRPCKDTICSSRRALSLPRSGFARSPSDLHENGPKPFGFFLSDLKIRPLDGLGFEICGSSCHDLPFHRWRS